MCSTLGKVLANSRSSSRCESFPFTTNLPKGVRSITPTFSITSLHSLPTGPNQLVRRKLGLSSTKSMVTLYLGLLLLSTFITLLLLYFYWLCCIIKHLCEGIMKELCCKRRTELHLNFFWAYKNIITF